MLLERGFRKRGGRVTSLCSLRLLSTQLASIACLTASQEEERTTKYGTGHYFICSISNIPSSSCPFLQSLLCGEVMKLDLNSYEGRMGSLLLRRQSQCSCVFDCLGWSVINGNSHPFGALQNSVQFNTATAL